MMEQINPILALGIFALLSIILYYLFRPIKGLYWQYKKGQKANKKTLIEDVLKSLFSAEEQQEKVTQRVLLSGLGVGEEDLIEVLVGMEASYLIRTEQRQITLLPEGREYALRIVRIHRLYEKHLSENTGYDKKDWHDKAEEMEHFFDAKQVQDLSVKLGHPRFDPHGDPIPTSEGELIAVEGELLSMVPVNTIGRIVQIQDKPEVIYQQILAEKIHIGSQVRVIESNAERVRFFSEGEDYVLAPIVASSITISVFDHEEEIDKDAFRLSALKIKEHATVVSISRECRGEARRRLLDLGFVKGSEIQIDLINPLADPTAYLVKGAVIALRKELADKILIKKVL